MRRYQAVIRAVFGVFFVVGGVVHLFLGRLQPDAYAPYGETALLPWLASLWTSFVMPNLGWLTILLGIYEIACGIGMFLRRTTFAATCGMIAFLVFITVLGYGWATTSLGEDLLKNRLPTIAMTALLVPLLLVRYPGSPDRLPRNTAR